MIEEEKEAIDKLEELSHYCALKNIDREDNKFGEFVVAIQKIENLIQRKDRQIQKLENKNKDLLRKLRNRVKEVKKLIKYSAYKKEFSRLNTIIEQKNKMINYMANFINDNTPYTRYTKELENEQGIRTAKFTEQYFEKQAKEVEK